MINQRPGARSAESPAAGTCCPGCQAELEASRCGACGAVARAGGFQVDRVIARTPHSRVYLARDASARVVALKELVFALVPDAQSLEAFDREAALLRQLDHPAIPRFVASFREGEGVHTRLYLAQEFVEGTSYLDWLETRRATEQDARQIAREVLRVLVYLHGLSPRVLHRDLKPANLIRRPDGSVAVVDFGAARDLVGGVTHGATLVGTFGYMPPEQLGGTVDQTCDLYALGATLVHLLARRPPWELLRPGTTELDFERAVNVSAPLGRFLGRLVAARREDRFQTAQEALAALDAREATPTPVARPRPARSVWVGLLGLGLVAAAVLGWLAYSTSPPPAALAPPVPPRVTQPIASPTVPVPPVPPRPRRPRPGEAEPAVLERVAGPREQVFVHTSGFTLSPNVEVVSPRFDETGSPCTSPSKVEVRTLRVAVPATGSPTVAISLSFTPGAGRGCTRSSVRASSPPKNSTQAYRALAAAEGTTVDAVLNFPISQTQRSLRLSIGPEQKPDRVLDFDLARRVLE